MKVVEQERITVMDGDWTPVEVIRDVVETGTQEDPFYVMDLGEVVARYRRWKELMPRVEPFYAVKCNDDKLLVSTLAALGAGFDCASKAEIELITTLGIEPDPGRAGFDCASKAEIDCASKAEIELITTLGIEPVKRIIFANPAKMASHIRYSSAVGVDCMTFDSETELVKIKQYMPHAQLVIRIRCDAESAQCPLGIKFGCDPVTEAPRLLKLAAVLGLEVMGVSFHVGSGAMETAVYARAIALCRAMFGIAASVGHARMRLLDLGGGFPGGSDTDIYEVAQVINSALEEHFPMRGVRVIAEPGRYFAAAAYTLAACVHAKREIASKVDEEDGTHTMYFINDGVYGSFNCVLYDHQKVTAEPLYPSSEAFLPCSVWGPTCDGLDCVLNSTRLPALRLGDWVFFRDMGAYTLPVASSFNGFPVPKVRAVVDGQLWSVLKELHPLTSLDSVIEERVSPPSPISVSPPPSPPGAPLAVFVECALK